MSKQTHRVLLVKLGQFLRTARKSAGLSQTKAGRIVGLPQSALSAYENGLVSDPSPALLRKMAGAYKIEYDRLVGILMKEKYGLTDAEMLPVVFPQLDPKIIEIVLQPQPPQ